MRTNLIIVAALVLVLGGAAYLLSGRSGRAETESLTRGVSPAKSATGTAVQDSIGGDPGAPREAVPTSSSPADTNEPARTAPAANAERPFLRDADAFWRRCMKAGDDTQIRDCMRRGLNGGLGPVELAELVCGDIPPDGPDRMLIEEAAALWQPEEVGPHIREFHSRCNAPGVIWTDFVRLQSERDPEWVERFAASLRAAEVFSGDDLVLLQALEAMAADHPSLRVILERGARGELDGSDAQVAFSIARSLNFHSAVRDGVDFLRGVVASPHFQGRTSEVASIVRSVLDGRRGDDERAVVAFLDELFDHPLVADGVARGVLALHRANRLPHWLSESDRSHLVGRARLLLSSDS